MPVMKLYRNGLTMGTPPGKNDHERAKRGLVTGWSPGAVRRHTAWLYSIDGSLLESGESTGYAYTLTMRDCPPDAAAFESLRKAWIRRVERLGLDRLHWVVEWQRRGVPHIHAAVYFNPPTVWNGTEWAAPGVSSDDSEIQFRTGFDWEWAAGGEAPTGAGGGRARQRPEPPAHGGTPPRSSLSVDDRAALAIFAWLAVCEQFGARMQAQDFKPIDGANGWLKYLSKHAARGVKHYQRQGKPEGWEKTGRLWGHWGEWPTDEPMRLVASRSDWHRLRRMIRSWRIADARAAGNPQRIAMARRMLKSNNPKLSPVRGVSDWVPESISAALVGLLLEQGALIEEQPDVA